MHPLDGPSWSWSHYLADETHVFHDLQQAPFMAPSVFSFFAPGFAPAGEVFNARMLAPEFQLLNAATAATVTARLWLDTNHASMNHRGWAGFATRLEGFGTLQKHREAAVRLFDFPPYTTPGSSLTFQGKSFSVKFGSVQGMNSPAIVAEDLDVFIEQLNVLLCAGRMDVITRSALKLKMQSMGSTNSGDLHARERAALQLLLMTPDASIIR
jgi:hypothetical protein